MLYLTGSRSSWPVWLISFYSTETQCAPMSFFLLLKHTEPIPYLRAFASSWDSLHPDLHRVGSLCHLGLSSTTTSSGLPWAPKSLWFLPSLSHLLFSTWFPSLPEIIFSTFSFLVFSIRRWILWGPGTSSFCLLTEFPRPGPSWMNPCLTWLIWSKPVCEC